MVDGNTLLTWFERGRKMRSKITSFTGASKSADYLGRQIAALLGDTDFTDVSPGEIEAVLLPTLKRAYSEAAGLAAGVQQANLRKLGVGLNALSADFDAAIARQIAEGLTGRSVEASFIENMIMRQLRGAVDETIRKNAEANSDMGLKVHIVRTYGDVGLRAGTKYAEECKWCLDRCGEWNSYEEAYAAGAFERHDGCRCEIEYDVNNTHTRGVGEGKSWIWYEK